MSDYNKYVSSINKIFEILAKMKTGWSSIDNLNYIETIEEYKQIVSKTADKLKNSEKDKQIPESLEELGNDW